MKYLKSILLSVALCLAAVAGYSSTTDEVTLTVSSDGPTKEEATKNALRSAIEQAYGTFVSANTTILNDELVKDEIVTIANGNIKSYEEISSTAMPDGSQFVTLKATVSVSKLISYAQSKGAETEFAGATFGMNLRLQEMNKENEKKVLDNLMAQIKAMLPYAYDRTLEVKDPVFYDDSLLKVEFVVTETPNGNMLSIVDIIENTLKSITLSDNETQQFRDINLPYYEITPPNVTDIELRFKDISYNPDYTYRFRNPYDNWIKEFAEIMIEELVQFRIIDNLGDTSYIEYRNYGKLTDQYYFSSNGGGYVYYYFNSSINRFGLINSEADWDYYHSNLFHNIPLISLLRCCMVEDIPTERLDRLTNTYILKPYPVKFEVSGYIPKSDISKYNNFRVERSDLKYE